MLAKDGERVPFHMLFHMTGAVETWLTRLASTALLLFGGLVMGMICSGGWCDVDSPVARLQTTPRRGGPLKWGVTHQNVDTMQIQTSVQQQKLTPTPPAEPNISRRMFRDRLVTWMQKTLMLGLDGAVREAALWEVDKPREEWLFGFPAELALLAGQVSDEASS